MTDYTGLKAEIAKPAYAGLTDAQIAAVLTAPQSVACDIPAQSAFDVLASAASGDWGKASNRAAMMLTGTAATDAPIIAAKTAMALLTAGVPIGHSAATVLQSSLSALETATDISAASVTAIQALGTTTTTIAAGYGFDARHDMAQEIAAARKWG
jgi:uncharacterized membrane protein